MADAENGLYPVFNIPTMDAADESDEPVFMPSPLFDYDTGDFVRDGANRVVYVGGREAYILWVLKILNTQTGSCPAYMYAGIDAEGAMQQPTRAAVECAFERTITEALMSHPLTERISDFDFKWNASTLHITFMVKAKPWAAFDAQMNLET